jgi:hypothetical protein
MMLGCRGKILTARSSCLLLLVSEGGLLSDPRVKFDLDNSITPKRQ